MTQGATRLAWVDAARGFCVLAVVLSHFVGWGMEPINGTTAQVLWEKASGQLTPIRMPTLFVLSGFLLSTRVRAGFADRRTLASAASSYYLYVVWLALFALGTVAGLSTGVAGWNDFVAQLVLPRTILWFVLGLALWTLILGAMHKVHPAVMLVALAVLSVASFWLPGQNGLDHYARVAQYGFFFGVGVYGKPLLRRLAAGRLWLVTGGAVVVYLGIRVVMSAASDVYAVEAVFSIVRDSAAALITIVVIAVLCRARWLRVPLVWIGRRTLPVYVMHPLIISLVLKESDWDNLLLVPGAAYVAPILLTLVISLAAIALHWVLMRTPLRALFELPPAVKRWFGTSAAERVVHDDRGANHQR